MFEPLPDLIRLRRTERNLSQERLAKMARVSRGQLALLEAGENVSLQFLLKVARALELTELPINELRLRAAPPELGALILAAGAMKTVRTAVHQISGADLKLEEAAASLEGLVSRALSSAGPSDAIADAAGRLANLPEAERQRAARTLRKVANSQSTSARKRATDTESEPNVTTARKRAR